jgi:hypothetical protein
MDVIRELVIRRRLPMKSRAEALADIERRQAELHAEIEARREIVENDRLQAQIEEWQKEHEQREQDRRPQAQRQQASSLSQKPRLDGIIRTWDDDEELARRNSRQ